MAVRYHFSIEVLASLIRLSSVVKLDLSGLMVAYLLPVLFVYKK